MFQIPSQDWPRRSSPLTGLEDLLKQNPLSDAAPQEERVPVNLVSDFIIEQITLDSVGFGIPVINGKFSNSFQFRSIEASSSRISLSLSDNTIRIDANASAIANSISLSQIGDVTNVPNVGDFLQFNGTSWITAGVIDEFYITDGVSTETLDAINRTLTFNQTSNINVAVSPVNNISITWSAQLSDLSDIPAPTTSNTILTWDGSGYSWSSFSSVSTGSVTDGQNVGTLGFGVFSSKLGSILRFRNIAANSSKVQLSLSSNNIRLDVSALDIANEIRIEDLSGFSGVPSNNDTIIYNGATGSWEFVSGSAAGISFDVKDQSSVANTFSSLTPLRIFGTNGIETNWSTSTDLSVLLNASLDQLNNVTITAPKAGDILTFNLGTSQWVNAPLRINLLGNTGSQILTNNDNLRLLGQSGITVDVTVPDTALIKLSASLLDLTDVPNPTAPNQVLYWLGSGFTWFTQSGGESNTASNVGTLGQGVFNQKTGVNLEFRNVAAASSKIDVTLNSNNILLDAVSTEIADEINLEELGNVTSSPTIDGFLKYDGTQWVTVESPIDFTLKVEADSGINLILNNDDSHIIAGDELFIYTNNTLTGIPPLQTKKTDISLNIEAVANNINLQDLSNILGDPSENDILVYNGTKFVFQPIATQISSGSWSLSGNTESTQLIFGTLNNFEIPIYTNNNQIGVFTTDGRFGLGVNSPSSTIEVEGSVAIGNVGRIYANYTATIDDFMLVVDATAGDVLITLPNADDCYRREYVIKKIDNTSNLVHIYSSSYIDGSEDYYLYSQFNSIKVKSDGINWLVF
ncbi:MAG: hypothetical protein RLZZ86_407 [Cyanobacteriota bacterium]